MKKKTAAALIVAGVCWLASPLALDAQEEDLFLAILTMVEEDVERHGTHELFQMDGPWFIDVDSFLDNLGEHQPEVRFRPELVEKTFGVPVRASDREHAWECVGTLCKVRDYGILVEVHDAQPLEDGIVVDVIYDFTRFFGSRDQPGIYRRVLRGCVERTPQGWRVAEFGRGTPPGLRERGGVERLRCEEEPPKLWQAYEAVLSDLTAGARVQESQPSAQLVLNLRQLPTVESDRETADDLYRLPLDAERASQWRNAGLITRYCRSPLGDRSCETKEEDEISVSFGPFRFTDDNEASVRVFLGKPPIREEEANAEGLIVTIFREPDGRWRVIDTRTYWITE